MQLFAQRFFSAEQLRGLALRVRLLERAGADRAQLRGMVNRFLNSVLGRERKLELRQAMPKLSREFAS